MTNSEIAKGLAHWLACNFMIERDEYAKKYHAWLSCQTADLPAHNNEVCQRVHRRTLAELVA